MPAFGDQRPECFRYLQSAQIIFVVDRAGDEFEAHRIDFSGRLFDLTFDLIQRERIIGALVPIALAIDGVKIKSGFFSGGAPVVALGAGDALHGGLLSAASVTAMAMICAVQSNDVRAAEAAIGHAAIRLATVRVRVTACAPGSAIACAARNPSIPRRRRGTHHGQNDTARPFHVTDPRCLRTYSEQPDFPHWRHAGASESQPFHGIVRCESRCVRRQPPPEKCDANACANAPNPPRVTPPEPGSDEVPDDEWLDEVSLLKKLLRDDPPDEPRLPLDEDPRAGTRRQLAAPTVQPFPAGPAAQFSPGISA